MKIKLNRTYNIIGLLIGLALCSTTVLMSTTYMWLIVVSSITLLASSAMSICLFYVARKIEIEIDIKESIKLVNQQVDRLYDIERCG